MPTFGSPQVRPALRHASSTGAMAGGAVGADDDPTSAQPPVTSIATTAVSVSRAAASDFDTAIASVRSA